MTEMPFGHDIEHQHQLFYAYRIIQFSIIGKQNRQFDHFDRQNGLRQRQCLIENDLCFFAIHVAQYFALY